jgi:hypothetical protein
VACLEALQNLDFDLRDIVYLLRLRFAAAALSQQLHILTPHSSCAVLATIA